MVTTTRPFTLDDLLNMPQDGQIYEILGGQLVVWNAPATNHSLVVAELTHFLMTVQDAGYGYVFPGPHAVAFDYAVHGDQSRDVTHPDLYFIKLEREDRAAYRVFEGVPDLVIEVLSPSNAERDLVEKLDIHRRNGVPHYWIVNPRDRTIDQYTLLGPQYTAGQYGKPVTLREGDILTCPLFPSISVPLSRILRNVRDRTRRPWRP